MMGKRGPRKESSEFKLLKNTFRPDRDSAGPKPKPLKPAVPEWLPEEAKAKFKAEAPILARLGILTDIDGDEFARYCLFTIRAKQAEKNIEERGLLVPSARGDGQLVKNPACQIARDYSAAASKLADKFGLNPSARHGLVVPVDDDFDDEMEKLLSKPEDCNK